MAHAVWGWTSQAMFDLGTPMGQRQFVLANIAVASKHNLDVLRYEIENGDWDVVSRVAVF